MDTSVFVAREQRRGVRPPPPGRGRISIATVTELKVGVRRAGSDALRALRGETLASARRFIAVPYDERVSPVLASLLAEARVQRRKPGLMDAVIAATAVAHDLVVWTQDGDFDVLSELMPQLRVHPA